MRMKFFLKLSSPAEKQQSNIFVEVTTMIDFTAEEKELLESFEKNEWKSLNGKKGKISLYNKWQSPLLKKTAE